VIRHEKYKQEKHWRFFKKNMASAGLQGRGNSIFFSGEQ